MVEINGKSKKAIKMEFKTSINVSADEVWAEFKNHSFWINMFKPKSILKPIDNKTLIEQGQKDKFKLTINGFIPFGKHYILWKTIDDENKIIRTEEYGGYVKVWNNSIRIIPINDTSCIIQDEIILWGGILTKPTSVWAKGVFKKRHNNIKKYFNHKKNRL